VGNGGLRLYVIAILNNFFVNMVLWNEKVYFTAYARHEYDIAGLLFGDITTRSADVHVRP